MSLLLLFQSAATTSSTLTKNQSALARISASPTKTQPATSRIALTRLVTQPATARIATIPTKTQTSTARIVRTRTATQTAIARIAGVTTQIVFTSPSESVDFGTVAANDNTVTVGNVGTGYVGKSIRFNFSATSNEGSVHKVLTSTGRIMQLWLKVDTAATLSTTNDATVIHAYSDNFTTAFIDVRIIGVGTGFTVRTVDPTNSFASSVGVTVLAKGAWHRVVLEVTDAAHKLYLNNQTTPEVNYTHTNTGLNISSFALGKWFNAASAYVGIMDIDNVWVGNPAASVSTTAQQIADAWVGYKQKYLSLDGAIVRPPSEGSNLGFSLSAPDVVSESQAYGLKLAVQNNDQAAFDLIENWTYNNLDRRNSTVANTSNNAAPTTALNLISFHYNTSNADGKGPGTIYDANFATDADVDRAQALLWAHARYGSGGTINYLSRALAIIGDLRTYGLRQSSATGFYYLVNDSFQTSDPVQIAPDYNNPAAFKLFAQYDTTNAAIWNGAVSGVYDIINKVAAQQITGQTAAVGLNSNWIAFTLSTGLTSATASTYGDPNYGFNAFRSAYRIYDTYIWYGDTSALTSLQKPKSFFTTTWAGGSIKATYNHDGTTPGTFELNYFYYAAYWSIFANDTANTTASAILSGKLASTYLQSAFGSYLNESSGGTQYAYFGQSWMLHGAMQKAGLFINYGQSINKTQTATARIATVRSSTQTATARIARNLTKTQSAIARVLALFIKTQSATSRISNARVLSQSATARVSVNRTSTQSATARISASRTFPQTATARISPSRTFTQSATARITAIPSRTQTAIARIAITRTRTQSATARISTVSTKLQLAIARIAIVTSKTQSAIARIANSSTKTQLATARISFPFNKLQTATARIQNTLTKIQTATARIQIIPTKTQIATARIQATPTKPQSATARIQAAATKTQSAIARISSVPILTKLQTATARITNTATKLQTAIARIQLTGTKAQSSTARIQITLTKTQSATARIASAPILTKIQTATARIQIIGTKSQTATARIQVAGTKIQTATARIQTASTKTQLAAARIGIVRTKTQTSTARIGQNFSLTQTATARIQFILVKTQSATARIAAAPILTKTQLATARIVLNRTKTQTAAAFIFINILKNNQTARAYIYNPYLWTTIPAVTTGFADGTTSSTVGWVTQTNTVGTFGPSHAPVEGAGFTDATPNGQDYWQGRTL